MAVIIRDLSGRESSVRKKPILIDGVEFVFGKKSVTGKPAGMFLAYEVSTGHLCGGGKTQDEAIEHIKKNMGHIKAVLSRQAEKIGGLFA